ncbi:uncharacterized protein LOC136037214 [Artemia franciscana]|uniref:Uncharacterized protein n=1 Tax=Artemia franciscana TaxID=6661 RepID=A0AA88L5E0_ARTSF|nr:hypothetical protein QYM36_004879 [Artemia franciscana]KAK2719188.1 hypothetical protein QYM36_004879 [Artemia franciscana]
MDSFEDDNEDWFYNTISRYGHLLMYDLLSVPYIVTPLSKRIVLMATKSTEGRHSLVLTQVPRKLLMHSVEESGRCKHRDFSIFGGINLEEEVLEVRRSQTSDENPRFFCLLKGKPGLTCYSLDNNEQVESNSTFFENTNISTFGIDNQKIVFANGTSLIVSNLESQNFMHKVDDVPDVSKVVFKSEHILLSCNKYTGQVSLYDLRSGDYKQLSTHRSPDQSATYTFACESDLIVNANSVGAINCFDLRTMGLISKFQEEGFMRTPVVDIQKNKVIVCSGSGSIPLYSPNGKIFEHEGHIKNSVGDRVCTLFAAWHHDESDLIFSCADDGSLHAWEPLFDK